MKQLNWTNLVLNFYYDSNKEPDCHWSGELVVETPLIVGRVRADDYIEIRDFDSDVAAKETIS